MGEKKNSLVTPERVISLVAVLVAIISLFISMRSLRHSGSALSLAKENFRADRTALFGAELGNKSLKIVTRNPNVFIEKLDLVFPNAIAEKSIEVVGNEVPYIVFEQAMHDYLSKTKTDSNDSSAEVFRGTTPLIVVIDYIARAEPVMDRLLYYVEYHFEPSVSDKPKVRITKFYFDRGIGTEEDLDEVLDELVSRDFHFFGPRRMVDR